MLKPKNDDKKKKALDKPKGKRQPRTRLTVFLTLLIILIFIIIVLILRSPILELPVVTPTVAARLATLSPDPAGTLDGTAVALQSSLTVSPALPLVGATDTPNSFTIGVTLPSATNLYAGPGSDYPIFGHLDSGAQLVLIGANTNYTWYQVALPQGLAWVDASVFAQSGASLRQLPVIQFTAVPPVQPTTVVIQGDFGTQLPFPTNTSTFQPIITTTPVVVKAGTSIPVYTAPNFNFATGSVIPTSNQLNLLAVSEDRQWYLVTYTDDQATGVFNQQVWVQASIVGTPTTGDINLLQVIPLQAAPLYVRFVPPVTATPTPPPTIQSPFTLTVLAAITATPVIAQAKAPIPIYTGPGPTFETGTTIPVQTYMRLIGVSEDRQWYLVQVFSDNTLQVWVQASTIPEVMTGDFSFVPPISAAEARGYVTFVPFPTATPLRVLPTRTRTKTPTPSRTPVPSRTQTPSKTPSETPLPRGT